VFAPVNKLFSLIRRDDIVRWGNQRFQRSGSGCVAKTAKGSYNGHIEPEFTNGSRAALVHLPPVQVETRLKAYGEVVDRRLNELLPPENIEPKQLHAAMRYSCLAPGKRLRPALCIASAEAVGARDIFAPPIMDAACAVELVHCFSLIHDDLPAIDNDDLRRGALTCHRKFGEALALLAGDALFALAFQTASHIDAEAVIALRCVRSLSIASGSEGLVGGEVMDVLSEGCDVDAATLEFIHVRKTGALIASSCEIGALLGGGDAMQVEAMRSFGLKVGLAFQIIDDLLNEISTPEQLGKAAGSDRHRNKATYPALYGIEGAKEAANRLLEDALRELAQRAPHAEGLRALAAYSVQRLH
jgi:geranylgeranyl diphosphate synthase type II